MFPSSGRGGHNFKFDQGSAQRAYAGYQQRMDEHHVLTATVSTDLARLS